MTMAADSVIDMLMYMDGAIGDGTWSVKSIFGESKQIKGGLSLKFDKHIDDVRTLNALLVKKIVFQAIQILHFAKR